MKKYALFVFMMALLLGGCGAKEPAQYAQAVLPAPDRIEVDTGNGSNIVYEPGSGNYQKLYDALSANWWLTGENGTDLREVTSLQDLKTTSDDTFRHTVGDIVYFLYEENPVRWDVTEEEQLSIGMIGFVIPEEKQEGGTAVKGHFLIAQKTVSYTEGLYTYFYPPEIANDLWGFLNET